MNKNYEIFSEVMKRCFSESKSSWIDHKIGREERDFELGKEEETGLWLLL